MTESKRNPTRRERALRSEYAEVARSWLRDYTAASRRFLKRQLVRLNRRVFKEEDDIERIVVEISREREEDGGRFIADVVGVRGAAAYGETKEEAIIGAISIAHDIEYEKKGNQPK